MIGAEFERYNLWNDRVIKQGVQHDIGLFNQEFQHKSIRIVHTQNHTSSNATGQFFVRDRRSSSDGSPSRDMVCATGIHPINAHAAADAGGGSGGGPNAIDGACDHGSVKDRFEMMKGVTSIPQVQGDIERPIAISVEGVVQWDEQTCCTIARTHQGSVLQIPRIRRTGNDFQ